MAGGYLMFVKYGAGSPSIDHGVANDETRSIGR
jgi:hypothetical protein